MRNTFAYPDILLDFFESDLRRTKGPCDERSLGMMLDVTDSPDSNSTSMVGY